MDRIHGSGAEFRFEGQDWLLSDWHLFLQVRDFETAWIKQFELSPEVLFVSGQ